MEAIGEALKKTENLGIMGMVFALMVFGDYIRTARPYFWTELERAANTTVGPILRGLEAGYAGRERKKLLEQPRTFFLLPPCGSHVKKPGFF